MSLIPTPSTSRGRRWPPGLLPLLAAPFLLLVGGAHPPPTAMDSKSHQRPLTDSEVAAWKNDLHQLVTELPSRHKNLFFKLSRDSFESAARGIESRIPRMERYQVIVALMRLVAMAGDAHTTLNPTL